MDHSYGIIEKFLFSPALTHYALRAFFLPISPIYCYTNNKRTLKMPVILAKEKKNEEICDFPDELFSAHTSGFLCLLAPPLY
ncbi:hypothetical protein KKC60_02900 [Patescibacteria group bacterium]|nr:hypothetical protein [Patescibacteria group bacterium]